MPLIDFAKYEDFLENLYDDSPSVEINTKMISYISDELRKLRGKSPTKDELKAEIHELTKEMKRHYPN